MGDRAKPVDEPKKGAPLWVVTFTDMSSLLLTFFILILTFSSTEKEMLAKAEGSLQGAFGLHEDRKRDKPDLEESISKRNIKTDKDGVTDEKTRLDQFRENMNQVQSRDIFDVKIDSVAEGFRLVIPPPPGEEHFALLTGRLNRKTEVLLEETGRLLRSMDVRVVVRTHVDGRTWRVKRGQDAIDWTLEHALDAAAVLESVGFAPERVSVSPRGNLEPLEPDDDGEIARYHNRRLELLVIPDSRDPIYRTPERED
ncbi:MAG: flagellar motor protein MotB [Planctomycetota bacterium]